MDIEALYLKAKETLEEILGRRPTPDEVSKLAQEMSEILGAQTNEQYKEGVKYGEG